MSNRANIDVHLANMIGGRGIPVRGQWGFCAGAPAFKTIGEIGLGLYINRGTKDSCDFRGLNGQSPILEGGAEQLLYEEDLTQNYDLGAKEELPDGRVFRYCKSTGAGVMTPQMGCNFTDTGYFGYTVFLVAAAQGATEITIPAQTHATLLKDQLRGGYVVIFDASGVNDVTHEIVGNDAADANALFKVRLATKLTAAIVASTSWCEVYSNPWSMIAQSANNVTLPRAGVPVYSVTAAATYFWLQTKGIKFVTPQSGIGADNGGTLAFWKEDGSMEPAESVLSGVTLGATHTLLPAATVIAGSQAGNGPIVNLLGF